MTIHNYFGYWWIILDKDETLKIIAWLKTLNYNTLCPKVENVFKAFKSCSYNKCRLIIISQDPYPQKNIATGLAFANTDRVISPSLKVIRDSVCNFDNPYKSYIFDPTMNYWAEQGVLLLNSALTTEVNKVGVHVLKWSNFMIKFLKNMSLYSPGIVYILFGKQAQALKPYINSNNYIFEEYHPAYYARCNKELPNKLWKDINTILYKLNGSKIKWLKEINI